MRRVSDITIKTDYKYNMGIVLVGGLEVENTTHKHTNRNCTLDEKGSKMYDEPIGQGN